MGLANVADDGFGAKPKGTLTPTSNPRKNKYTFVYEWTLKGWQFERRSVDFAGARLQHAPSAEHEHRQGGMRGDRGLPAARRAQGAGARRARGRKARGGEPSAGHRAPFSPSCRCHAPTRPRSASATGRAQGLADAPRQKPQAHIRARGARRPAATKHLPLPARSIAIPLAHRPTQARTLRSSTVSQIVHLTGAPKACAPPMPASAKNKQPHRFLP